jgi:hypothetical protein
VSKKITIAKWQLNLVVFVSFVAGIVFTFTYLINDYLLPKLFATNSWTQSDWSGESGTNINTTTPGQIQLTTTTGWTNDYTSWGKRAPITITNSGSGQTNYQVKLNITYNSGMKADFGDLRFTNSVGTTLNYWVQSQTNSTSAVVWVKVDALTGAGDTTIYMYYGNSVATTASNGNNTFDFFDDFNDGILDSAKWTKTDTGNKITEADGKLKLYYGSGSGNWDRAIYTIPSFTRDNWSLEFDMRWTSDYVPYDAMMWGWKDNGGDINYTNLIYGHYNQGDGNCTTNCASGLYESGGSPGMFSSWSNNTDYQIRERMRSAGGNFYEKSIDGGANWTTDYTSTYSLVGNLHPAFMLYSGDYLIDNLKVRKWMATEPTSVFGTQQLKYPTSGILTSNIFDTTTASDLGKLTFGTSTPDNTSVNVKVRTSNSATMIGAADFNTCTAINSNTDISSNSCVKDTDRYVQYQITLNTTNNISSPTFYDISIEYSASDQINPTVNATSIKMLGVAYTAWTGSLPTIGWTGGTDNEGGSGILGYCIALDKVDIGTSSTLLEPSATSGMLAGLDDHVTQTFCPYIVIGNSLNLASIGLTLPSNKQYNFSIKAVDKAGNIYAGDSNNYQDLTAFYYDNSRPTNVTYISTPGGNFSNVNDMSFTWPIGGNGASTDVGAGVLGWQYQVNNTDGEWLGTTHDDVLGIEYIPSGTSSYTLTNESVGGTIVSGSNTIYFRTVDKVGNFSTDATVRTGALSFGGAAPSFGGSDKILIDPENSTTNSFALSWPEAEASKERKVTHYYYMVNTPPPSSLDTLKGNSSTYIDIGGNLSVEASSLAGVNKGTNTVYVVAIDDGETPNYSPSNYISGTFTLNSTDPDNVANLIASDSSIKSQEQWNVTLTWTSPIYKGAGNLTYDIYRSINGTTFTKVGSTSGLSYVDNTPSSAKYYYKIYTRDGASATSAGSNGVSITPTGKWTTAPSIQSGPTTSSITTKKATISWSTDRAADSKVQYGTSSGDYYTEEPSNSTQGTAHTINLTNLSPGTTYFYKVKWTDEDGNTGTSSEKSFSTDSAPVVTDPKVKNISISSAILEYTTKGASKVKVYFGKTTAFGGLKEVNTSSSEGSYITELIGLEDGTKYYYKINTFDSEESEYEGNVLAFETLPRPKISNVRIQEVKGASQPTVLVSWTTNTETSSIVTYYPEGQIGQAKDEINITSIKGEHKLLIKGLLPNTPYILVTKGRDKVGNEALSDSQKFTTATDTRPPQIMNLKIEGSAESSTNSSSSQSTAQLVVSWDTDEPGTSQIEFGEGTSNNYSQKTQEDTNLTSNHLVIISNLTPSKVYHIKAHSKDKAGNDGTSIDTVTITPKSVSSAFDLVIGNLTDVFGFLKGINQ